MSIESTVAQNLQTPRTTSYTWDISHAFVTTYHPYCHSPSALTEYLKQKLRHQRAKHLGRSPTAQVKQNVPLERNSWSEVADEEGYFVFDTLSQTYLPVEYEANTRQWYFIRQDT